MECYSSCQTKFHENTCTNHVNFLQSEVIITATVWALSWIPPKEIFISGSEHIVFTSYFVISGNS